MAVKFIFFWMGLWTFTSLFLFAEDGKQTSLSYPTTPKKTVTECLHGVEIQDGYRWLEKGDDSIVKEWVKSQHQLTNRIIKGLSQKENIFKRLEQLSQYEDINFQEVSKSHRRFIWIKKFNQEHWVLNYQDTFEGPLVELLNPNKWKTEETLEFATPSLDGQYVAYGKAKGGNERPVIHILNVTTKKDLSDTLKGSKQGWPWLGVSWLPDNRGFYYSANPSQPDEANREEAYWNAVYFHRLGSQAVEDVCVFFDEECKENLHFAQVSDEGDYLILNRFKGWSSNDIYLQRLSDFDAKPELLVKGNDAHFFVHVVAGKIYILTNSQASQGQLLVANLEEHSQKSWSVLIPETKDRLLRAKFIDGKIFAEYLHQAHTVIKVFDLQGCFLEEIVLPSIGSATVDGYWHKPNIRIEFTSFIYPRSQFYYQWKEKKCQLIQSPSLPFNSSLYHIEQVWYPSKDHTLVSMFLIYRKDLNLKKPQPLVLIGYGGFDFSLTPTFSDTFAIVLEAGGIIAIPNLRGGGEYGKGWHDAGKLEKKQNVFDDYMSAAEWLIANHYTVSSKLGFFGKSNGGLLVGAVMTQRPDLANVILAEVPLLDMLRYHHFAFANLWVEEYGSAQNAEQFKYLHAYSPYHQLKEGCRYPASLWVGADLDARVDTMHVRKMVARLQSVDPLGGPHLLMIEKNAGHLGGGDMKAKLEMRAIKLAFLFDHIGLGKNGKK